MTKYILVLGFLAVGCSVEIPPGVDAEAVQSDAVVPQDAYVAPDAYVGVDGGQDAYERPDAYREPCCPNPSGATCEGSTPVCGSGATPTCQCPGGVVGTTTCEADGTVTCSFAFDGCWISCE